MRLVQCELTRQLEMERDVKAVEQLDHGEVVELANPGDRHRRFAHALAQGDLGTGGLDVDDDVASGERPLDCGLDAVCDGVPLADRGARRDSDHDVGERPTGSLPQSQPPYVDRRLERRDRGAGRPNRIGGCAIHEDVHVPQDQPRRGNDHEEGDEQGRYRVSRGVAGPHREQADEDGERAGQVAAEVERVGGESRAREPSRGACRDDHPRHVDRDDEADGGEDPPRGRGLEGRSSPPGGRPRAPRPRR